MTSISRRSSFSSANSSSLMKRAAVSASGKASTMSQTNKRAALGNLTNRGLSGRDVVKSEEKKLINKPSSKSSMSTAKKGSESSLRDAGFRRNSLSSSSVVKLVKSNSLATSSCSKPATTSSSNVTSTKAYSITENVECKEAKASSLVHCSAVNSPARSIDSMSLAESMSICGSMKSPEFEYVDNGDSSPMASLERRACTNLHICDIPVVDDYTWTIDVDMPRELADNVIDVDKELEDPQLCATYAWDIYHCLRNAEMNKRPSTDYMEKVQKDINQSMRSILVDWLVEVSEEYRLVPETLYLTVNYIDRYLSGNEMTRQRLQLLGVACMLIASKYEEICAPQVEEFCYITDNTYFKEEVVQMEADVLKYLKYEMSAPTTKCFMRRFVRVAQRCDEIPVMQTEFVANYIAELSLLEYSMLCYPPSLIAASAVYLSRFLLQPEKYPWNSTLSHYTRYQPSDLSECVKALHHQLLNSHKTNLPAIREKYNQHKYKFAARKYCPPLIPSEFFGNLSM